MKCPRCNSEHNEFRRPETGPHAGALYCKDCGRWLRWEAKPPKVSYKDNTTWQAPTSGWTKPIFGRRHIR